MWYAICNFYKKNIMSQIALTNLLIGIVIALISFVSKRVIDKLDSFEKKVQDILISDVSNKKDIEVIKSDLKFHDKRISKLEEVE
jgi:hypothetical protein